jgi:hypothetical protein
MDTPDGRREHEPDQTSRREGWWWPAPGPTRRGRTSIICLRSSLSGLGLSPGGSGATATASSSASEKSRKGRAAWVVQQQRLDTSSRSRPCCCWPSLPFRLTPSNPVTTRDEGFSSYILLLKNKRIKPSQGRQGNPSDVVDQSTSPCVALCLSWAGKPGLYDLTTPPNADTTSRGKRGARARARPSDGGAASRRRRRSFRAPSPSSSLSSASIVLT